MSPLLRRSLPALLIVVGFLHHFQPLPHALAADPAPASPATLAPPQPTLHGYTSAQLDDLLQSPDPKNRLTAILMLRDLGGRAVPIFIWALEDEDPSVRIAAVNSFRPLGPDSEPAATPLANLLEVEPLPAVRNQIIFTLWQMGPYAAQAIPTLRRLQRDGSITVRLNASQALERILGNQPQPP